MKRAPVVVFTVGVAAVAGMVGYMLRARAEGIPTSQPLFYRGSLIGSDGTPARGVVTITVSLFSALTGGSPLCASPATAADLTAGHGQFRVPLNGTGATGDCVQVIHANPDLWVAVTSSDPALNSAARTKLGAVPYAVEADHAVTATSVPALDTPAKILAQVNTAVTQGGTLTLPGGVGGAVVAHIADFTLGPGGAGAAGEANWTVACDAGETLVGGGCATKNPGWTLWISSPGEVNANSWVCYAVNRGGGSTPSVARAYVRCVR